MTWVKLDDHFDENPKIAQVGPLGIALWVTGLAYCNRNLTDGFIPWATARKLLSWEYIEPPNDDGRRRIQKINVSSGIVGNDVDSERVIILLLAAGLWDEDDDGYRIHDFDQFQPTRAQVEAERAAKVAAGQAGGRASAQARAQAAAQAKSNPVPVPDPVPVSVPDPDPEPLTSFAGDVAPKRAAPRTVREVLTDEQRGRLLDEFSEKGLTRVEDRIDEALNHKNALKYKSEYLYVRGWLRRDLDSMPASVRNVPRAAPHKQHWSELKEGEERPKDLSDDEVAELRRVFASRQRMGIRNTNKEETA